MEPPSASYAGEPLVEAIQIDADQYSGNFVKEQIGHITERPTGWSSHTVSLLHKRNKLDYLVIAHAAKWHEAGTNVFLLAEQKHDRML